MTLRGWAANGPTTLRAVDFSLAEVGSDGLMSVQNAADWARGDQGGENIEANALLYHALVTGAQLATVQGDSADVTHWTNVAATLRTAINAACGTTRPASTGQPHERSATAGRQLAGRLVRRRPGRPGQAGQRRT